MIHVCFADHYPVTHQGIASYFEGHPRISIDQHCHDYEQVKQALAQRPFDVLVLDLELDGLHSIYELRNLMRQYPSIKFLIFTSLKDSLYAPNAIKAGIKGYVNKTNSVEYLDYSIEKVFHNEIIIDDQLREALLRNAMTPKTERKFKKLSYREVEVLRYFCEGKKNHEVAKILNLNEKTISTYKLRLQTKFEVDNLVDLVDKAKEMELV